MGRKYERKNDGKEGKQKEMKINYGKKNPIKETDEK